MPSPFPGMDPFLEHPDLFSNLHHDLITFLQAELQSRLPEPYFAAVGTRVWVESAGRVVEPDVDVLQPQSPPQRRPGNGVAVLTDTEARPVIVQVPEEEHTEAFLNVYARRGDEQLVTSVEVLSPKNKSKGAKGRMLYRRRQREMRQARVNLVEIDLLRAGRHTTVVSRNHAVAQAGPFDYHACVQVAGNWRDFHVYPIQLQSGLPKVAVHLAPGDPVVTIDLQHIFDRAYEIGPYRRRVRYAESAPVPPLRPDQAEWAAAILREKGLLPPAGENQSSS